MKAGVLGPKKILKILEGKRHDAKPTYVRKVKTLEEIIKEELDKDGRDTDFDS